MSERTTLVVPATGEGVVLRGHVEPRDAIARLERIARDELERARRTLEAIAEGRVVVYHQRGVYVNRDRRQVWPEEREP